MKIVGDVNIVGGKNIFAKDNFANGSYVVVMTEYATFAKLQQGRHSADPVAVEPATPLNYGFCRNLYVSGPIEAKGAHEKRARPERLEQAAVYYREAQSPNLGPDPPDQLDQFISF